MDWLTAALDAISTGPGFLRTLVSGGVLAAIIAAVAAGRHHRQHVATIEHGAHHVLLAGSERRVSEVLPKRVDHIDHEAIRT